MLKLFLFLILFPCACLVYAQGEPFPDVPQIQQAELLIESGKSQEAYALLQPLELDQAGNIRYDYLLGISALNLGKASQAVFALERVQETNPEYGEVGLWLAIAFYRSGDTERATLGFNSVIKSSPNWKSRASANEYLDSIKRHETTDGLKENNTAAYVLGKIEFGVGYDDNISNFSSNSLSSLQTSNALTIPSSNLGGMESILNLGIEGRMSIGRRDYAFVSVDEGLRKYPNHGLMNSETLIARGGMNFTSDDGTVSRISLARRLFTQQGFSEAIRDIDNDYNINGVEGSSRLKLSEHDYLGGLAQYNQLHFEHNSLEDTNQVMVGVNYMHLFQVSGNPVFYFGYTHIADTALQMKTSYVSTYNDGMTVASRISKNYNIYLQYSITKDVDIFSAGYINFRNDTGAYARDSVVAFGEDRTKYLSIGLNWRPWHLWTVGAQVAGTSNISNISLYSYNKTESRITLKREFNSL